MSAADLWTLDTSHLLSAANAARVAGVAVALWLAGAMGRAARRAFGPGTAVVSGLLVALVVGLILRG
ncbi:hypothetical protein [Embleya hyalina]|uniref:Uncharacterized protein n=1 Tax=Embleya hyalina TaxID=516124 RepID=A0A401Z3Y8_9ACTN|nr:hypothetical protein [Embleya hyalina]GCE01557.1 hypothetical protein EHYA_09323 [Embleya hyalina]